MIWGRCLGLTIFGPEYLNSQPKVKKTAPENVKVPRTSCESFGFPPHLHYARAHDQYQVVVPLPAEFAKLRESSGALLQQLFDGVHPEMPDKMMFKNISDLDNLKICIA